VKRPQGFDPKKSAARRQGDTPRPSERTSTPSRLPSRSDSQDAQSHVAGVQALFADQHSNAPEHAEVTESLVTSAGESSEPGGFDSDSVVTHGDELALQPSRAKQALRDLKRAQRQRRASERRERRRFLRPGRIRRQRVLVAASSVLALAVFVGIGVLSPALNLRTITVVGAERLDPAVVSERLESQLGTPLALLNTDDIRGALGEFTLIEAYSLETLPPHELVVRIVERKPVITLKRGDVFDLVDPAGVVIDSSAERIPGYPLGEGLVVDVNSPAFTATAKSLAYMQPELSAQVNVATASTDQDVTFVLASGLTIFWGSSEDSVRKSVLVNTMLTSLAGQPVSSLDVSSVQSPVFS